MLADHPSEYLAFRLVRDTGKTQVWAVTSKRSGDVLGHIQWWGAWRQYVFAPADATVFNVGCMDDITGAIGKLMSARREVRRG